MPSLEDLYDDQALELDRQKDYVRSEIGEGECNQVNVGSEMGLGLDLCSECNVRTMLQICQSAAGFYIGTRDCDGPFCRATEYYPSIEMARQVLDDARKDGII